MLACRLVLFDGARAYKKDLLRLVRLALDTSFSSSSLFLLQHCEQIRVYQTCIGNECFIMECCFTLQKGVFMNTGRSCLSFLLLLSSSFTSLCCLVLFLGSDDNLKEGKTDCAFVISMGIVGVKSTAGREVKFVDPSMTTRGESA